MPFLNKVFLVGRLTRQPECRYTTRGTAIGGFSMALNRQWQNAEGEIKEEVCFVEVEVIGESAESARNYLDKGSLVYIEGRLRMSEWQDKHSGQKRKRLKITARQIQFLSSPGRSGNFV